MLSDLLKLRKQISSAILMLILIVQAVHKIDNSNCHFAVNFWEENDFSILNIQAVKWQYNGHLTEKLTQKFDCAIFEHPGCMFMYANI